MGCDASRLIIREVVTTVKASKQPLENPGGFYWRKMTIVNQYSAVWIAVFLILIAGGFLLSRRPKWPQITSFSVLVVGLVVAWIFLHPRQTGLVLDPAQVQGMIGHGMPVLLEFQSPY
jgi:hypothetical protein